MTTTDLWGAPVTKLTLARNEITWLLVRGTALVAPRPTAPGLRVSVVPLTAHGDAVGARDGKPMATADGWLIKLYASLDSTPGPYQVVVRLARVPSTPCHRHYSPPPPRPNSTNGRPAPIRPRSPNRRSKGCLSKTGIQLRSRRRPPGFPFPAFRVCGFQRGFHVHQTIQSRGSACKG